jgi:type IV pilus assembly protein PilP
MKLGLLFVSVMALLLSACGASSDDELRQWMSQQKRQAQPRVKPLPEPKQFKPESYKPVAEMDPFSDLKLTQALRRESGQSTVNNSLITPELARRKQPLEAFPLDAMMMVGSLHKAGKPVALVTVNKLLYQVRPGDYLGQNYGKVLQISETEMKLREIVQDAAGEWIEREAALHLQERTK